MLRSEHRAFPGYTPSTGGALKPRALKMERWSLPQHTQSCAAQQGKKEPLMHSAAQAKCCSLQIHTIPFFVPPPCSQYAILAYARQATANKSPLLFSERDTRPHFSPLNSSSVTSLDLRGQYFFVRSIFFSPFLFGKWGTRKGWKRGRRHNIRWNMGWYWQQYA